MLSQQVCRAIVFPFDSQLQRSLATLFFCIHLGAVFQEHLSYLWVESARLQPCADIYFPTISTDNQPTPALDNSAKKPFDIFAEVIRRDTVI